MNFVNNVTINLSDEEMAKIKDIDLDELYNFVADDFSSWNHLVFENVDWSCHIFKSNSNCSKNYYIEKWPK